MAWIRADDDVADDNGRRGFDAETWLYVCLLAFGALCMGFSLYCFTLA